MITHQELVDRVAAHDGVADTGEARRAAEAVVHVVAPRIDPETRVRLQQALPSSLRNLPRQASTDQSASSGDLARQMGDQLGCTPERGLHLARVVLAEIATSSPELSEDLAGSLPEELAAWVGDPIGAVGRSDTGITGAPSRLDEPTLRAAQGRLPDWEGDTHRLTRAVRLPADRIPPLLARIDRISGELGRRAHHEITDDGIAFSVWTASVDAVTTIDIELAERIDQAVADIGSGG